MGSTRNRMHLTLIKIVLVSLAAIVLVACGREPASSATSVAAEKDSPKGDAKKASKPDEAPRVADPMKEGY